MQHSFVLPSITALPLRLYHQSTPNVIAKRTYPAHVHGGYELYILEEGEASFAVDGAEYRLREGDAIFVRPDEIHNCIRETDGRHNHFCLHFGEEAEPFISRLCRFAGGETHISLDEYGKASVLSLARGCEKAAKSEDELLLLALFLRLLFFLGGESQKPTALPPLAEAVKAEMDGRFSESGLLDALCREHFISASTLNRLSNRYFGTSPKKYIEKKRFSLATRLLREGKSVSEAASAAGFADTSGFIRLFRLRFGVTPLAYRRLCNEGDLFAPYDEAEFSAL